MAVLSIPWLDFAETPIRDAQVSLECTAGLSAELQQPIRGYRGSSNLGKECTRKEVEAILRSTSPHDFAVLRPQEFSDGVPSAAQS